ncbi:PTS system mannose/fructose/sorbose family transporter subunit IID [Companilactobacillus insicii]|uniref:PTS system mannose/fructose/sorbose family transporter subunit IID n=1 Tax=Companilactobacillus insicii TaxID=1732567 RepID=UPI000F7B9031|nr:PTS system mannose/fructose/sorbose family transporter subunit IID [Companilactobacillus insicii]
MTSNTTDTNMKKVLNQTFWRTFTMGSSWEYTKQMATGYCYAMVPALKKIYHNNSKGMSQAMQRHMEFFNITNVFAPLVLGTSIAMEQKNAQSKDFDTSLINNIKVSLMGPLSAIGDSLIMSTFRIIATGIAISFAMQGNVLGPILFLAIYNIPCTILRYYGLKLGYEKGTDLLENISDSNLIQNISEKASILGMFVIGSMTASLVVLNSPVKFGVGKSAVKLTSIFNQILPNSLPLLFTIFIYWLLKKHVKIGYILLIIIGFSILGTGFKFLSA